MDGKDRRPGLEEAGLPAEEKERQPFRRLKVKNRPGFETRTMRWVYRILYPYFHCRVSIPRELQESGEPVVFIANHYNVFGPVSMVLSLPFVSRAWINEELIREDTAAESFRPGLKSLLPFLKEKHLDWLCQKVAKLAIRVLGRFGVIPVNRRQPSRLISTMRQSVAALEAGEHLLIFPETGDPEYSLTSVTPFYSGFATLGWLYYRKTGKILKFCPCYVDEQHHQIRLGETVSLRPETDPREETERVSEELNRRIREMAAESRGVAREKGTPVRQTILFFCNLIRFLLLIPLNVMLGIPNPRMILLMYCISQGIRILFNAVCSTYAASNRLSFLFSHAVGMLADLEVLAYLSGSVPRLGWLTLALALNGLVILFSNIRAFMKYRRCAGVNYFDTLSANLLAAICLQQMLRISLSPLVLGALEMGIIVFLACSAGFALAFNARIGREEGAESVANQGAE